MPSYDYLCEKCNKTEEISKKLSDYDRIEHCPYCGEEMKRQVAGVPFHLLGSNWAKDGYHTPSVTYTNKKTGRQKNFKLKSHKND